MLLTADVVIVVEDDDDVERAAAEVPTQFTGSDNFNHNKNIFVQEELLGKNVEGNDAVESENATTTYNVLTVRRFPVCQKQVQGGYTNFSRPFSNFVSKTMSLICNIDQSVAKAEDEQTSQCKCTVKTDLNSVNMDWKKVFPLLKPRLLAKERFPCCSTEVQNQVTISDSNLGNSNKHTFPIAKSGHGRGQSLLAVPTHNASSRSQSFPCVLKNFESNHRPIYNSTKFKATFAPTQAGNCSFPLYETERRILFPINTPENAANSMITHDLLENQTNYVSTNQSEHILAATITETTVMTQCQNLIGGHARDIQVQYKKQVLDNNTLQQSNNCLPSKQHINDAKLATASMAKNTTATNMQNNDESNNSVGISLKVCREQPHIKTHNSYKRNEEQPLSDPSPPPPLSEYSVILEKNLDATGTNITIAGADSYLHTQQMPATCSDVRGSSLQAVLLLDGASAEVKTRTLPAKTVKYDLELLPKSDALERNEPYRPEVNDLTEIEIKNNVAVLCIDEKATNVHKYQEQKRETEIANVAMTITEIEESEQFSENSLIEENSTGTIGVEELIDEMKFEMKSVTSSVPERDPLRRHTLLKNEPNIASLTNVRRTTTERTDYTPPAVDPKFLRTTSLPSLPNAISHSVPSEALDTVLPTSTRLRRQRRLYSQGSEDQPEDPIERLNRLRARISGALSEVKGVLKQYSTETEGEVGVAGESANAKTNANKDSAVPEKNDGPVKFRFVKIVRRRSIFNEEDEDKEKQVQEEEQPKTVATDSENQIQNKIDIQIVQNKLETVAELPVTKVEDETNLRNMGNILQIATVDSKSETPTDDVSIAEPVPIYNHLESHQLEVPQPQAEVAACNATKPSTTGATVKPKKKIITKTAINRRASIAAVEGSKIEPPITPSVSLNLKTQRRPSDSEAIVKKKVTVKNTAAGEAAPKVKIIHKVRRPSVKNTNTVTTVPPAISTQASDTKTTSTTSTALHSSSETKTQANFSSKDVATAVALATQLVIDDASLTIATTNDASLATKLEEAGGNAMVALSLSPLQTSEANSQAESATDTLVKLVGETVLVGKAKETAPINTSSGTGLIHLNKSETKPKSEVNEEVQTADILELANLKTNSQQHSNEKPATASTDLKQASAVDIPRGQTVIPSDASAQVKHIDSVRQQVGENSVAPQVLTFSATPLTDVTGFELVKTKDTTQSTSNEPISIEATKADTTAAATHSPEATSTSATTDTTTAAMPELQVKALQVFITPKEPAPFNVSKDEATKKKVIIKKLVRKNSTDKPQAAQKSPTELKHHVVQKSPTDVKPKAVQQAIQNKVTEDQASAINAATKDKSKTNVAPYISEPIFDITVPAEELLINVVANDEAAEDAEVIDEIVEEPPAPVKKQRRIKKKVIIKRQQRKLSISDTFFKSSEEEPSTPNEETLEKTVEYVKVDTDEEHEYEDIQEPAKPTKGCLKLREFQVGDPVMYAERFRKTQVKWKKGIVLERITSISYKLEVEGKEVPAHISYIKKYTERKVNFGGKEYLEIDYEQIAEEEEKARRYSIWNMV